MAFCLNKFSSKLGKSLLIIFPRSRYIYNHWFIRFVSHCSGLLFYIGENNKQILPFRIFIKTRMPSFIPVSLKVLLTWEAWRVREHRGTVVANTVKVSAHWVETSKTALTPSIWVRNTFEHNLILKIPTTLISFEWLNTDLEGVYL